MRWVCAADLAMLIGEQQLRHPDHVAEGLLLRAHALDQCSDRPDVHERHADQALVQEPAAYRRDADKLGDQRRGLRIVRHVHQAGGRAERRRAEQLHGPASESERIEPAPSGHVLPEPGRANDSTRARAGEPKNF